MFVALQENLDLFHQTGSPASQNHCWLNKLLYTTQLSFNNLCFPLIFGARHAPSVFFLQTTRAKEEKKTPSPPGDAAAQPGVALEVGVLQIRGPEDGRRHLRSLVVARSLALALALALEGDPRGGTKKEGNRLKQEWGWSWTLVVESMDLIQVSLNPRASRPTPPPRSCYDARAGR